MKYIVFALFFILLFGNNVASGNDDILESISYENIKSHIKNGDLIRVIKNDGVSLEFTVGFITPSGISGPGKPYKKGGYTVIPSVSVSISEIKIIHVLDRRSWIVNNIVTPVAQGLWFLLMIPLRVISAILK
ncbi:hypothetical protein [Colwellia piezophila]|uniref:hypothetical protein n=1 Tax=Colwellia piezophila TaxID=211668 RepID=UPI00058D751D|nr:hypothetical protein [Colwellia piezophila]